MRARSIPSSPVIGSILPAQRQRRAPITEEDLAKRDLTHRFVVASTLEVDDALAKHADFRQSFRIPAEMVGAQVHAVEVYCRQCRRTYEDVADKPCSAKINNEHLIGGDQRERAKRKAPAPMGDGQSLIPGPRIQRRGITAVVRGEV